ncbi:MAG: PH domain-containing protein [Acidimicrobiia bacterium]|nr:PH domain-containing protein [Acidimicrobiia bacterium]
MPYPERLLSPDESIVTQFRPHWQALLIPIGGGVAGLVAIVLAAVFLEGTAMLLGIVGIVGIWLLVSVRIVADWWTTQYVLTTERVVRRAGVFSRSGTEIPLEVINNVAFSQGFLERLVRSGDLLIESAGETGQSRFTDIPDPEGMQSQIYQVRERRQLLLNSGGTRTSTADELAKLADLRDRGILSAQEFEDQKRRLLEQE